MPNIVALVTARGGSKGVPGKNLAVIAGKPLVAWSVGAALGASAVTRVLLSTDDPRIADAGRAAGAEVPFLRPPGLARDDSSLLPVVLHALDWLRGDGGHEPDALLLLQPTSPLRDARDIDDAAGLLSATDDAVVGVCPTHHHPLLVQRIANDGRLERYVPAGSDYPRRQDLPPAYALNGAIYLIRPAALREHGTFFPPRTRAYVMPPERSLDVDEPWDLHLVRLVMENPAWHPRLSRSPGARSVLGTPASSLRKPA
ncbi:acylneuraminate cytidylyltransferase family protein [Gemmata sp. G18]|uniref:Acylneuraminate cytidylyltransferase family protein n=1 Tax=Gemmata palustris TaxID=2822762 RepID=A0ABS5BPZ5_9BACT|nr:acylneuraminate cytidylyltransferase family protein [Gemmata palustris]MBP3955807.1 acylneuraminate cytidylyltransferase family protein [Gemmata palustris]